MRTFICPDCMNILDDDDLKDGAYYTGPRCIPCRENYWDECCFECGALPNENHQKDCSLISNTES